MSGSLSGAGEPEQGRDEDDCDQGRCSSRQPEKTRPPPSDLGARLTKSSGEIETHRRGVYRNQTNPPDEPQRAYEEGEQEYQQRR